MVLFVLQCPGPRVRSLISCHCSCSLSFDLISGTWKLHTLLNLIGGCSPSDSSEPHSQEASLGDLLHFLFEPHTIFHCPLWLPIYIVHLSDVLLHVTLRMHRRCTLTALPVVGKRRVTAIHVMYDAQQAIMIFLAKRYRTEMALRSEDTFVHRQHWPSSLLRHCL